MFRVNIRTFSLHLGDGLSIYGQPERCIGDKTYVNTFPRWTLASVLHEANERDLATLERWDLEFAKANGDLSLINHGYVSTIPGAVETFPPGVSLESIEHSQIA